MSPNPVPLMAACEIVKSAFPLFATVTDSELTVPIDTVPKTMLWGFTTSAGPSLGLSVALPSAQPVPDTDNKTNPAHKANERICLHAFPYQISTSTHVQAKLLRRMQSTGEGDRKRTGSASGLVPVPGDTGD